MDCLIHEGRIWQRHDTLPDQLRDLIRTRNPRRHRTEPNGDWVSREIDEVTRGISINDYGRWVYYPWSGRLVHLLPPGEFHELRTDRNRNKITRSEQQRLANCTVAIVGLSVGNAIAMTLALEDACGHLKLGDLDTLELSNMNRIRASVDQLGLPKTILTARQIYELNPYAKLSLFHEGVTPGNLEAFLRGDPAPDIVIDECDDIRMKILLRERAREYGIPVLMETSDRGMLDVERFDLEPHRPILHGLLGSITGADLPDSMNNEEKIRYVLPVIGIQEISARSAASMLEIGETLTTWPQPGADVTLGGATVSLAVRLLALGCDLPSGRRHIDLQELITHASDNRQCAAVDDETAKSGGSNSDGDEDAALAALSERMHFLAAQAALAPSGGNSQPWRFYVDGNALWLAHDKRRSRNLLDPKHTGAYLALGAALKNISVAAAHRGYRVETELFPQSIFPADPETEIVARILVTMDDATVEAAEANLFPFLGKRVTNRKLGTRLPLMKSLENELREAAAGYSCQLAVVTEESALVELGRIVGESDRLRFLNAELHREMMSEIRWSARESEATGDGIDVATLELSPTQEAVMKSLRRPEVAAFLRQQHEGTRLRELSERSIRGASAMGLISVDGVKPKDAIRGGQAMQHLWLLANARGWSWHPLTALLYLFDLPEALTRNFFDAGERELLGSLSSRFGEIFPAMRTGTRLMLFRLAQADPPTARSLRLPLEKIIFKGRP